MTKNRMKIGKGSLKLKYIKILFMAAICLFFINAYADIGPAQFQGLDPSRVKGYFNLELTTPVMPRVAPLPIEKVKPKTFAAKPGETKFILNGIIIKGSTVYSREDLAPLYQNYLGKKIGVEVLQNLAEIITVKYRNDGYISSRAFIPPQKINTQNAIITIQVIEGFISEVKVSGYADGAEGVLLGYGEKLKEKRPVRIQDVERYTLLANDLPGFEVKAILVPSPVIQGGTELTFATATKKLDGIVTYDNRGTRYLGPQQVTGSVSVNDVTHAGDQVTLQTLDTTANNNVRFIKLDYNRPLGSNGTLLMIDASYTKTHPGFLLEDLDLDGTSKYASIAVNHPWIRSRRTNLYTEALFDYLNGDLNYTTGEIFDDRIRSLRIRQYFDYLDEVKGYNTATLQISHGLGILGASSEDQSEPLSRPNGVPDYMKVNLDLSRLQEITDRFSLLAAARGQYSFNDQLLSAEEFGFGGSQYGRGYDPYEISGDDGVSGKLELEINTAPDFSYLKVIQYYIFYDIGEIWNLGDSGDQLKKASASSTGVGGRVKFNQYFSGNLEADKPLTRAVQAEEDAHNNGKAMRYYFGISANL